MSALESAQPRPRSQVASSTRRATRKTVRVSAGKEVPRDDQASFSTAATWPNRGIAARLGRGQAVWMSDPVIERAEVAALLFNVSDIAVTLTNIERLLGEEDDGEEEADEG